MNRAAEVAAVVGVLTASLFPILVIGASIGQPVLLRRPPRDPAPVPLPSPVLALIHEHLRGARLVAAVASALCAAAAAAFLGEELPRILSGHAGDYGVIPGVLLIAVVAAGLPSSWVVAAVAGVVLLRQDEVPRSPAGPDPVGAGDARAAPSGAPARVLRVFFDWGHPWPLWESGTDKYAMEPADYGYSPGLTDLLRRWKRAWIPIADFAIGEPVDRPTAEQYALHEALSTEALAAIRAETPDGITVHDEVS